LGLSNGLIVGSKVSTRPTVVLMLSTLALPELFTWSIRSIGTSSMIWLSPVTSDAMRVEPSGMVRMMSLSNFGAPPQ
jgi:hypothetical protein